jgi:hypothetical protein
LVFCGFLKKPLVRGITKKQKNTYWMDLLNKGISMRTKVGLWIDHRKAIVVAVTDKGGRDGTDHIEG